ncbi:MAG TPA: branched-chain amino acid ABC transporter substrate-binding protein [Rhodospirillales bacterium]|nr:branched-chain amino acid ABC transporter substrate-binding protein [Rhodospirillales bacterium]
MIPKISKLRAAFIAGVAIAALSVSSAVVPAAKAADPIKIGFSMALTGPLAGGGKQALVAMEMWADDVNKKGGLLGRTVKLVHYDDQTNPKNVPGIYAKLLDIDKVDFVVSGYGTNLIAPALPVVIQRDIVFIGLFGMNNNKKWKYDKYFQILPSGPDPAVDFSRAWFDTVMQLKPKPKSIAFVAADAEFARNLKEGAVVNAKRLGLKITYNKNYKPGTPDFTPIIRAVNATNPDVFYVASYPAGSAGMTRAISEVGSKVRAFGGGMVGLQFAGIMKGLGPKLNGVLNYDFYVPEPNMNLYPGVKDLLARYQKVAPSRKVDPLGYYLAPWAYAYLQILGDAVNAVGKIDHAAIAKHIHATEFTTVVGKVKFAKNGEWAKGRTLTVQWQNIKNKNDLQQFTKPGIRKIMAPAAFATGTVKPFNALR